MKIWDRSVKFSSEQAEMFLGGPPAWEDASVTPTPRVVVERFYDTWNSRGVAKLQSRVDGDLMVAFPGAPVRIERVVAETDDTVVIEAEKGEGRACEIV